MKIKQYKLNDRVASEYLGDGTIVKIIPSFYNKKLAQFYIVLFDKAPDVRYNLGNRESLILPDMIKDIQ